MTKEEALKEVEQQVAYKELLGQPITADDLYDLVNSIYDSLKD